MLLLLWFDAHRFTYGKCESVARFLVHSNLRHHAAIALARVQLTGIQIYIFESAQSYCRDMFPPRSYYDHSALSDNTR